MDDGSSTMQALGTLKSLWRYPVKSMGGEELDAAYVTFTGLLGDRVYSLLGLERGPNKPWLTARQRPAIVQYRAAFGDRLGLELTHPELLRQGLHIRAPDGSSFTPEQPGFLAHVRAAMNCELRLRASERNMVDAQPLSLIGMATIEALATEAGTGLDPRRFRANCYIEWQDATPFGEDRLVGAELQIGQEVRIRVNKRDKRCKVVNVDPDTAAENPAVLDTIYGRHEGCAGVYASVLVPGVVRRGDEVALVTG